MAANLVIVITADTSIANLNGQVYEPTKVDEALEGCRQVLEAVRAGTINGASVQVTVRDSAPSISTSGSGSTQAVYAK